MRRSLTSSTTTSSPSRWTGSAAPIRPVLLQAIETTLDAMARGGIYDQVGGGFHRYATDNEWLVPHFEKMLYDQAQLGRVYLLAWRLTGNLRDRASPVRSWTMCCGT